MSKLEGLIEELCPDGVEYVALKEIATFSGAGVDKKINTNEEPVKLLNYMDIYKNNYIDNSLKFMEVTASENKRSQCNVLKGDVFITPSSEILNDIGNAAVITEDLKNVVYSYHIMRIRLKRNNFITSKFIGYMFESNYIQAQINKLAEGITRYGLTKTKWENIIIPLPPLEVQEEIVRILDNFTELTAELTEKLTAELTARKKQYEYYRDLLLTFGGEVEWKTLGEIGELIRGSGLQKKHFKDEGVPCIHYGQLYTYYGLFADKTISYVSEEYSKELRKAQKGDVLISGVSENIEDICTPLGWFGEDVCISGDMFAFRHNQNTKYIAYLLKTTDFSRYKERYAHGAKVTRLSRDRLLEYKIPIPPLAEQERIVSILDKFDALTNDISIGLSAEIEARQKQYEYYREKLLSFKELDTKEA